MPRMLRLLRLLWYAAVLAVACGWPDLALAQGFRLDRHRMPPLPGDLLWLERPAPASRGLQPFARLGLAYADDPLSAQDAAGTRRAGAEEQLAVQVAAGASLGPRVHLVARWALWWQRGVWPPGAPLGTVGLGDPEIGGRIVLLDREAPLELALAGRLAIPVGEHRDLAADDGPSGGLSLLAGRGLGHHGSFVGLSVGLAFRPSEQVENLRIGHELRWVAGGRLGVTEQVGLTLELAGSTVLVRALDRAHTPLEVTAGADYVHPAGVFLRTGVGAGITPGYGAPDARILLAVGYRRVPGPAP